MKTWQTQAEAVVTRFCVDVSDGVGIVPSERWPDFLRETRENHVFRSYVGHAWRDRIYTMGDGTTLRVQRIDGESVLTSFDPRKRNHEQD